MKLPTTCRLLSVLALIVSLIFAGSPDSCSLDSPGVEPDYSGRCPTGYERRYLDYNGAPWCFKANAQAEPSTQPVHYASGLTDYTVTITVALYDQEIEELQQFYYVDGEPNEPTITIAADAVAEILRLAGRNRPMPAELAVNLTS